MSQQKSQQEQADKLKQIADQTKNKTAKEAINHKLKYINRDVKK